MTQAGFSTESYSFTEGDSTNLFTCALRITGIKNPYHGSGLNKKEAKNQAIQAALKNNAVLKKFLQKKEKYLFQ